MRALIISSDLFEDRELVEPLRQLRARGVDVDIAAPRKGLITGKHWHKVNAALALGAVSAEDYDLLILPGGKAPASLRKNPEAIAIVRHFLAADKPVAVICHGPLLLIAAGQLAGRSATCYREVKRDLEAAGAIYEDRDVVVDRKLITSRQPADIPAFMQAIFRITGLSHDAPSRDM